MKKTKLLIALLLCLLVMAALIHTALAAQSTVTIESQTNSAFDYLEYYADGQWKDLNTPRHWIESTGEIVYCVLTVISFWLAIVALALLVLSCVLKSL